MSHSFYNIYIKYSKLKNLMVKYKKFIKQQNIQLYR